MFQKLAAISDHAPETSSDSSHQSNQSSSEETATHDEVS